MLFSGAAVRTRLQIAFALILGVLVVVTVVAIAKVRSIDEALRANSEQHTLIQRHAINFRGSAHDRSIAIRDVVLADGAAERAKERAAIDTLARFYEESAAPLERMIAGASDAAELSRLYGAIRDIEREDDIPDAIKARILGSLKRAQASGDPSDLVDLSQLGNLRGLDDLGDMINGEIERALKQAGKRGNVRIGKRGVTIDLSDDDHQWSWSWDDQASPFDDPNLDWLKGTPFAPDDDFDIPDPPDPPDFDDLDLDLDLDLDVDDVQLDAGKIAALEKIAADEEKATRPAQQKVVELGRQLKKVVGGADPNQAEIDHLVDAITAEEAKIRKARLGALTQSRKVIGK